MSNPLTVRTTDDAGSFFLEAQYQSHKRRAAAAAAGTPAKRAISQNKLDKKSKFEICGGGKEKAGRKASSELLVPLPPILHGRARTFDET